MILHQDTTALGLDVVAAMWANVSDDTVYVPHLCLRILYGNVGTNSSLMEVAHEVESCCFFPIACSYLFGLFGTALPFASERLAMSWE